MTPVVARVVLVAAVTHAAWNAIAQGIKDQLAAFTGLVLWARTRADLAPAAALRETSIIAGAVIGMLVFKERFGRPRVLAAAVVVGGIGLMPHAG